MHAGGLLRPHETTASMIVKLAAGAPPRIAVTGTSHPCLSLFKPAAFDAAALTASDPRLFAAGRAVAAAAQDRAFRARLRASIAAREKSILNHIEDGAIDAAEVSTARWAEEFLWP